MNERTDLDENEVLDFGCLLEDALELWQEVVGGDDVADLGLVDAEGDGVVAEVGVQRNLRNSGVLYYKSDTRDNWDLECITLFFLPENYNYLFYA